MNAVDSIVLDVLYESLSEQLKEPSNLKIEVKPLCDVSDTEYEKLEKLRLSDGMMRTHMNRTCPQAKSEPAEPYKGILAFTASAPDGELVGWAYADQWSDYSVETGYFVEPKYRKKGIGRKLLSEVMQWGREHKKQVYVQPWDYTSTKFFEKTLGVTSCTFVDPLISDVQSPL